MAVGRRPVYVISIAASLAGCHPRTLRIYEEEGLLEPVRTDTNIRLYSDEDLERVRAIRYLTQIRGVNLAGVKLLLQLRDASELLDELVAELAEREADSARPAPLPVRRGARETTRDEERVRRTGNRSRRDGVEL
jgi:MerR family transcriptional regulator/heat shock protein HspR